MDAATRARYEPLYRATDYCVEDPRLRCRLRIDEPCEALATWLRAQGHGGAVFITAWNPHSLPQPDQRNRRDMRALQGAVEALGLPALKAIGRAFEGDYSEPSLLVAGLGLDQAQALMQRFAQNACLWFDCAAPLARLQWREVREPGQG
ncbi:MAG: DUF3293 domain-containing protein [Xanthomonadales bacterium]|nr:DUF3293 domain-containing protein [Xanthomonadales bacterium]